MSIALSYALALFINTALAEPPPSTIEAMYTAIERLQDGNGMQSYKVTTRHTWSEEGSEVQHIEMSIAQVAFSSKGKRLVQEVERLHDGESAKKADRGPGNTEQLNLKLDMPFGAHSALYVYGPNVNLGLAQTSNFQPAPGITASHRMVAGTLAWNPLTMEPVWMEFKPMGRSDRYRIELAGTGDELRLSRLEHQGEESSLGYRYPYRTETEVWEVVWQK